MTDSRQADQMLLVRQATLEALTESLENMTAWLEDQSLTCDAGSPDGGSVASCAHCQERLMVQEARKLLKQIDQEKCCSAPYSGPSVYGIHRYCTLQQGHDTLVPHEVHVPLMETVLRWVDVEGHGDVPIGPPKAL